MINFKYFKYQIVKALFSIFKWFSLTLYYVLMDSLFMFFIINCLYLLENIQCVTKFIILSLYIETSFIITLDLFIFTENPWNLKKKKTYQQKIFIVYYVVTLFLKSENKVLQKIYKLTQHCKETILQNKIKFK